jgi:hypothetical protein
VPTEVSCIFAGVVIVKSNGLSGWRRVSFSGRWLRALFREIDRVGWLCRLLLRGSDRDSGGAGLDNDDRSRRLDPC